MVPHRRGWQYILIHRIVCRGWIKVPAEIKYRRQRHLLKVLGGKIINMVETLSVLFLRTQRVTLSLMFKSKSSNIAKAEISKGLNLQQVLTISLPIAVSQVQHLYLKCKLYNKNMVQGFPFRWVNLEVRIIYKDHAPQFLRKECLLHYHILKLLLKSQKIN